LAAIGRALHNPIAFDARLGQSRPQAEMTSAANETFANETSIRPIAAFRKF
jgi:hypothetical protein